jgi:hypothetical protein
VCCGRLPPCRRRISTRSRMPSRARSCTSSAMARWPISARFRSAVTTAPSTRRPSSLCSPACISSAQAIARRSKRYGPASKQRSDGSTFTATATRTASSNTTAKRRTADQPGLEGFLRRDLPC